MLLAALLVVMVVQGPTEVPEVAEVSKVLVQMDLSLAVAVVVEVVKAKLVVPELMDKLKLLIPQGQLVV